MASRCSSASLAASPASFQPSNAATTIVLCRSGNEALTSGGVTQSAYGVIMVAARRAAAILRSCRRRCGRDEIRSAANWLVLVTRLGVQTSGDNVDFSGREALQRF